MLTHLRDINRQVSFYNDLFNEMNRVFQTYNTWASHPFGQWDTKQSPTWPRFEVFDRGQSLLIVADLPGLSEKDVQISANAEGLNISGERQLTTPEGYNEHRRERSSIRFARGFTFPCSMDLEKTTATMKNGVLEIEIQKAPEAQPRQIQIKAQ